MNGARIHPGAENDDLRRRDAAESSICRGIQVDRWAQLNQARECINACHCSRIRMSASGGMALGLGDPTGSIGQASEGESAVSEHLNAAPDLRTAT